MLRSTALRAGFRHARLHLERAREDELAGKRRSAIEQLEYARSVVRTLLSALEEGFIPPTQCYCDPTRKSTQEETI